MKKQKRFYLAFVTILIFILSGCTTNTDTADSCATMKVHYIDTGESDSILIESDHHYMLIDAGDVDDVDTVVNYLNTQKVKKLDYLILTHPHADHIGAASEVVNTFTVGKIIMPSKANTTKVFETLLDTIASNNLKITKPVVGNSYTLGNATFTLLAPNSTTYGSNLNNHSISLRLVNGNNSFLFIGDCEAEAISDILENKQALDSDVLLCGHHGSKTSTTAELLDAVTPTYAVISVGNNSYGHPSDSTLSLLKKNKITTYRTDESGTIIATSTGSKITFTAKASDLSETASTSATKASTTTKTDTNDDSSNESNVVYITDTGSKYHKHGCRHLDSSNTKTTIEKAKKAGYEPCKTCKPAS
ncbi:ComEC/Rec2 family competence protein [Anaerosporobacter sp.]|uniref:ComEC/Rec2 family competence protein n=1 Tax=Anaerosporobacter sp. TaxID=1872529 RepID=UPI00286F6049|nr:ComEC/Rec2 family competence protein [Anaerosporobacter sp.]